MTDERIDSVIDFVSRFGFLVGGNPADYLNLYEGAVLVPDRVRAEDITVARLARVDLANVRYGDYAEMEVDVLFELTDGMWATCMASCDTTGWDCQAAALWYVARTREDAIRYGLAKASRALLGVSLPDEVTP